MASGKTVDRPAPPALRARDSGSASQSWGLLTSRAYGRLRDLIVNGQLAPGTWVVEKELARRLGMSPTPVRAALTRLQQEGYLGLSGVEGAARLGVTSLRRQDMGELYFLIGDLEGWAARYCAELPKPERQGVANRLDELNRRLEESTRTLPADSATALRADAGFHRTIIEAGAGPRLRALLDTITPQAERYDRTYAAALADRLGLSVAEHREIARAIRRGDPSLARDAVVRNYLNGAERLDRAIEALGERGTW